MSKKQTKFRLDRSTKNKIKDEFKKAADALDKIYNPFPPKKEKGQLTKDSNESAGLKGSESEKPDHDPQGPA